MRALNLGIFCAICAVANSQFDPNWDEDRSGIVQLFQWTYRDIANECETFLGPKKFAGVQTSPVAENIKNLQDWNNNRPWWEVYQPVSYKIDNRLGNEEDFRDMSVRCNRVGVRIYPDVVFNHMSSIEGVGTAGSTFSAKDLSYPAVPFAREHFNPHCPMSTWDDVAVVRNCWLEGMPDIDQGHSHVQEKIVELMNKLIDLGVAGFRVDAVKHMWPDHLRSIFGRLKNLNPDYGFKGSARPFLVQEVIDDGHGVSKHDYTDLGTITEFQYTQRLGQAFRGHGSVADLRWVGPDQGLLPSHLAFTSVDNHDSERRGPPTATFKEPKYYKGATAWHFAFNYGIPRMLSSYDYSFYDQGPPADSNHNIISPTFDSNGQCNNGWVCQHRWRPMWSIVQFRNVVKDTNVENWWNQGANQVAFSRGNKGFIVFNAENWDLNQNLQTGLNRGTYCDVMSGEKSGNSCTGITIQVGSDGFAQFSIPNSSETGVIAIHVESQI